MATFVISKTSNGEFAFNLKASNGEKILHSERYTTKANCLNGVESVRTNAVDDARYDKLMSSNGKHYFTLKASNGQIIGTSELYERTDGRDNGIASVKKSAPDAAVDDLT
ncbi:YegP family protein [Chitinophaga lutea]